MRIYDCLMNPFPRGNPSFFWHVRLFPLRRALFVLILCTAGLATPLMAKDAEVTKEQTAVSPTLSNDQAEQKGTNEGVPTAQNTPLKKISPSKAFIIPTSQWAFSNMLALRAITYP